MESKRLPGLLRRLPTGIKRDRINVENGFVSIMERVTLSSRMTLVLYD